MAEVGIFYDRPGNTLTVWFGDTAIEVEAEESGDEVVLMKDSHGNVVGFEKLNFDCTPSGAAHFPFETVI